MNLKEQTIEQLKVIAFDIDQAIKKNQNDYQIVINVLNEKLQEQPPAKDARKLPEVDPKHVEKD